jgi:hypothetical protein
MPYVPNHKSSSVYSTPIHFAWLALQGWDFYTKLLTDDGHFAGDYGGPLFLMPGLIITAHISGFDLKERKSAMLTYLMNHQQRDGGWGLHTEGPSTVFGTTMNYVAIRLLGLHADNPVRLLLYSVDSWWGSISVCVFAGVRGCTKIHSQAWRRGYEPSLGQVLVSHIGCV